MERFHHCLKDALCAHCTAPDWIQPLPWVMLVIYMPCHAKTQTSLLPRQFLALLLLYLAKLQLILGLLWIILCQQLRQL